MSDSVLSTLRQTLLRAGLPFKEVEHGPTYTSEDSAKARGEPLGVGAKALLLRTDDTFRLFVLPADRKLDSTAVKQHLQVKKLRFANPAELLELTGLVPGSVPPFGEPLLPFELFADSAIGTRYDRIAFNAGSLTVSFIMTAADWQAIAQPKRFPFGKEQD